MTRYLYFDINDIPYTSPTSFFSDRLSNIFQKILVKDSNYLLI